MSGLRVPQLLVASQIVPWADRADTRLNPHNGLCLSALHDRAFDQGVLTIAEDLRIEVSSKFERRDDGIEDAFFVEALEQYHGAPLRLPADKFRPDPAFLAYHREHVFERWKAA